VTTRWRIRHKLMLGLGLVVLLMALLLSGTLRGLWSYYWTMANVRLKLAELKQANGVKDAIATLVSKDTRNALEQQPSLLKEMVAPARVAIDKYRQQLEENRQRSEVEDSHEVDLINQLLANLVEFERLILEQAQPRRVGPGSEVQGDTQKEQKKLEDAFLDQFEGGIGIGVGLIMSRSSGFALGTSSAMLVAGTPKQPLPLLRLNNTMKLNASDLCTIIHDQLDSYIDESRRHYQVALWIIVPASAIGLLSMAGLMRSFYGWVFNPIRDLGAGVERVAQGEFSHRIEVTSGDEMEDLATAFNEMMQRLADLYTDLARQVNERSRQLVRSERLASVGYLAAGVAHEINNPLHSIALFSEALEKRLIDLLRALRLSPNWQGELEVISRYLRMIQEEAFRCKKITERLLEFSRPGERKRESTDLVALVQSVVESVQVLPHGKGKSITLEAATERVPGGKIRAMINAEEVRSVLLNLAINALESMEDGGVLRIVVAQKAGLAELRFTDTGCGMTEEVLENIFEPFFTRSRTGKGTGLGLTISHRIIQQHGGDIEATSPGPNQGSTFIVRLPITAEPATLPTNDTRRLAA
jgi:signal transduction histidine kinase